ncbi:hypothetical protein Taro_050464 [Colocasia esculenta]|uniref:Uncharacterized protein n=1 Tax=Colocasia esculenta TaxID=4460 RepID=A0A843XE00_COLES|nr:hypothetical protein [Colocasia esculenta]
MGSTDRAARWRRPALSRSDCDRMLCHDALVNTAYRVVAFTGLLHGISISDSECITLKSCSSFDLTAAYRMGYKLVDGRVTKTLKGKEQDIEEESAEDDNGTGDDKDSQAEPMDAQGDDEDAVEDQAPQGPAPTLRDFITGQMAQLQNQLTMGFNHLNARLDHV